MINIDFHRLIRSQNDDFIFENVVVFFHREGLVLRGFGISSIGSELFKYATFSGNFYFKKFWIVVLKNIEIGQKLSSNFKKIPVQFDFGYTFTKAFFEQSLFETSSNQQNLKLSLGLRTTIKKEWIGNILGEYLIQKTQQNTLKNFLLGGQISYRKENSAFEYNVLFNNVLNLNSFRYINSSVSLLGIEEASITALHGYITGGMKFYF